MRLNESKLIEWQDKLLRKEKEFLIFGYSNPIWGSIRSHDDNVKRKNSGFETVERIL